MQSKLDIRTHHYFPFHFMALGAAFLIVALLISLMNPVIALVLFILGLLFTTTHYRVMVDTEHKKYMEYLWILGFKNGTTYSFEEIEDLYVNQVDRENAFGFVARVNTRKMVYMGFIKFANDDPVFIGEHRNENKLLSKIQMVANVVHLEIRKNYLA